MKNSVIHLITNRAGDFHHPSLASVTDYTPHTESAEEISLRDFLQLRDQSTDYYVIAAINAVYAFPELVAEFKESQRTFDLSLWSKDDDNITSNGVLNTQDKVFTIHRTPTEFPVQMRWELSYVNGTTMKIRLGDLFWDVNVRTTEDNVMYVDWPEELGISGALNLDNTWSSGDTMTIIHTPTRFPYGRLAEIVTNRDDARRVMIDRNYIRNFYLAQSDIEKCAILYTALAWPEKYEWS